MKNNDSFGDRLDRAAAARKLLLARFSQKPAADDPAVLARAAERRVVQEAREARAAERRAEREASDRAAAAQRAAADEQRAAAAAESVQSESERQAQQKAQRDARYAARKARKG